MFFKKKVVNYLSNENSYSTVFTADPSGEKVFHELTKCDEILKDKREDILRIASQRGASNVRVFEQAPSSVGRKRGQCQRHRGTVEKCRGIFGTQLQSLR